MKPVLWLFHALLMSLLAISPAFATTFQSFSTSSLSTFSSYGAAFGNFSTGGRQDMAITISDGSNHHVRIMHGDGAGGFSSYWQFDTAADPRSIVAADLNMDDRTDLIVSNFGDNSVSIFISNGDGTFQPRADYSVGSGPTAVTVGDFNGDGIRDDIAVINSTANSVAIMLNNGSGVMTVQDSSTWPTTADTASGIAARDFNGDDIDDIAVNRSSAGVVRIFRGNGAAGTFLTGVDITVGTTPSALASADFNNDGFYDLAVVNNGSDNISIIRGNASSSFSVSNSYDVYDPADATADPVAITAGDFNRDGVIDLAVANNGKNSVAVLAGAGDATFTTPEAFATGAAPTFIAHGDLNGNGNDLVTLSTTDYSYSLLLNSSAAVAGITVTPVNHNFGKIPLSVHPAVERSITLSIANNGSADLTISSMQLSGTNSGYFDLSPGGPKPCSSYTPSISANSSCTMYLRTAVPFATGEKTASVDITSNAANISSVSIPINSEIIAAPESVDLTLSFIGRGSGHVVFSPNYTYCESPTTCSSTQSFTLVTIEHAPDSGMYFYGWTGCDYVFSGYCSMEPATGRNITANFGVLPRRVKLNTTLPIYTSTVSAAYASVYNNEEIRTQTGLLDENLFMDRSVSFSLRGGYDSSWSDQGAPTIIRSLTMAKGSATIDNIMLK